MPKERSLQPRKIYLRKERNIPNSMLPVLVFRSVLPTATPNKAEAFRSLFKKNGWVGVWTDTIYDFTHFHSNAHELLAVAEGKVSLRLGGNEGRIVRLKAGDVLVLPAGTGHCRTGLS